MTITNLRLAFKLAVVTACILVLHTVVFPAVAHAVTHALATVGLALPSWVVGDGQSLWAVAALSTTNLTLLDIAKRKDPSGAIAKIVELLNMKNEILQDMVFKEGNLTTGELTTVRTQLPTVYWRLLNQGTLASKSKSVQITEQTGMLESWSQVDKALADLGGQPGAVRLSEARAFLEAMSQEQASTVFYGTAAAPEEFIGLAVRYSDTTAGNGDYVILGGGTGSTDNTSIWLISHDEENFCGIYPQGSQAGIEHDDLGEDTAENVGGVSGAMMRVYRDRWGLKTGIAVKDYRSIVRIANIDISNLGSASDAPDLITLMGDAEERIEGMGKMAWYANRTVRRYLRRQAYSAVQNGGGLTWETVAGKRMLMFGDTPIRRTDALLNTEDVVA